MIPRLLVLMSALLTPAAHATPRPMELRLGGGFGLSTGEALGGGAASFEHGLVVDRWVGERLSVGAQAMMVHDTFMFFDGVRGLVLEPQLRWKLSGERDSWLLGAGLGLGAFWDEQQFSLSISFAQPPVTGLPRGSVLDLDDLHPPLMASVFVGHTHQWRGHARSYGLRIENHHLDTWALMLCGTWGWDWGQVSRS